MVLLRLHIHETESRLERRLAWVGEWMLSVAGYMRFGWGTRDVSMLLESKDGRMEGEKERYRTIWVTVGVKCGKMERLPMDHSEEFKRSCFRTTLRHIYQRYCSNQDPEAGTPHSIQRALSYKSSRPLLFVCSMSFYILSMDDPPERMQA